MSRALIEYATPEGEPMPNGEGKVYGAEPLATGRCHQCPNCGGEVYDGFGLAYGGYGVYQSCNCGWWRKWVNDDD